MLKHLASMVVFVCTFVTVGAAADAKYFGTWKLNPTKSDFGPVTTVISHSGDEWTQTQDGKSYTFKMDGKTYPRPEPGATEVWKQIDSSTWEVTGALNGKTLGVDTYKVSADGKTLTDTSKSTDPTIPGSGSAVFRRAGSGKGLAGTWKGTVKQDPFTMVIAPYETDGLSYQVVGGFETKAHFDGKPYPMMGPFAVNGSTAAFTKTGPHSFESKQLEPGQPPMTVTVSASPDGKTLTAVGKAGPVKHVWVFDRQP